ncbi:betaine aldehyde dehydrogenase [Coccidioides immitis RMSCC 3703]|uniref:Betaine aldehyde dehydrogenase n=1 Tax=Coccidioides immitis RMSCC 3703 TaxID=454286 RepID=A0A0J8TYB0_COCIT|nr:betaine aldehyde dehydrogenase [Coccidioides immitis RMSCC 3703]
MSDLFTELTAPNGRKYTQPLGLFINNEFVAAKSGQKITSINPTNEAEIASVHAAGAEDVDIAVKAAKKALKDPSWKELPPTDRGKLMVKLAELVEQHIETLATIEAWDNGKPYSVAVSEDCVEVAETLRFYGGFADKVYGSTISTSPAKFAYTLRQPIGVVGQIIPWNYPLAMAAWKLGPALACGNTVVLKPAEQTPLSILYFANLIKEAGFPPGVVNILNGFGKDAGAAIASHLDIDKIAFTGSTATGRQIMKMAAVNMKNITLETGGKSPLLVFGDADLEQAANGRISLESGGVPHKNVGDGKGFFIEPTIFTNVNDNMKIYREEVFGPFVVIAKFSTEEEALSKANDTTYGLGAAVFTRDIERAHRVAAEIEAGMVWINSSNDSDFRVPFGGVKQSGIGRELGEAGLEAYSQTKAVHVNMGTKL